VSPALKYGLALLAVLVVIVGIVVWWRGRKLRRLRKYRQSWEQRSTMMRIKRDRNLRESDPDLESRPPVPGDDPASGGHKRR
jgi:hypothetical protein